MVALAKKTKVLHDLLTISILGERFNKFMLKAKYNMLSSNSPIKFIGLLAVGLFLLFMFLLQGCKGNMTNADRRGLAAAFRNAHQMALQQERHNLEAARQSQPYISSPSLSPYERYKVRKWIRQDNFGW